MIKCTKKHVILWIIIIIICIMVLFEKKVIYMDLYEDILFFKLLNKEKNVLQNGDIKQYVFNVTCNNSFQEIALLDTLKKDTLINKMLAPGIEGIFNIILKTNLDTQYNITFKSQTEKPKNLKFENVEMNLVSNTIEDLKIKGTLEKDISKVITIHWYWTYENTEEGDFQDTIDSRNIENYAFTIHAVGEQIL